MFFLLGPNKKKETQCNYFHLRMLKGFLSTKQTVLGLNLYLLQPTEIESIVLSLLSFFILI
jgi:hypothetical protein